MTKNLKMLLMCATFAVLMSCASAGFAQQTKVPMVGGFKAAPVNDAGAVAAANFAIKEYADVFETPLTLSAVQKAERQVVQGTNYRLCLEVASEESEELLFIQVIVYQSLQRAYRLSKWRPNACGE